MLIKLAMKIKKILPLMAMAFFLGLLIMDFNKFNFKNRQIFLSKVVDLMSELNNIDVMGNHYIPSDVVVKMIDDNKYDVRYDLLVDDLKVITISNNRKIIMVSEHVPLFCDENYIYLSSGNQIEYNLDIIEKEKIASLELDRLNSSKKTYNQSVKRVFKFINYLKNNYIDFYEKLDKVTYNSSRGDKSPHISLSVFIDGCKVLLSDEPGDFISLRQQDFEYKINILNNLLRQHHKIDEISEIDLRYDNHGVFFNLRNEDIDG